VAHSCPSVLRGKSFNVVATGAPPYMKNVNGTLSGVDIDLVNIFAKKIGFRPSFQWTTQYGIKLKSGKYTGSIGHVRKYLSVTKKT
jgi:hypothetical protein